MRRIPRVDILTINVYTSPVEGRSVWCWTRFGLQDAWQVSCTDRSVAFLRDTRCTRTWHQMHTYVTPDAHVRDTRCTRTWHWCTSILTIAVLATSAAIALAYHMCNHAYIGGWLTHAFRSIDDTDDDKNVRGFLWMKRMILGISRVVLWNIHIINGQILACDTCALLI